MVKKTATTMTMTIMCIAMTLGPMAIRASGSLPYLNQLKDCNSNGPLGMISGQIHDWQITASSTYPGDWDRRCHERFARVFQPNGVAWCAKQKSASEWIQVDLGLPAKVTGLMTQGRGDGTEWVISYLLSHSLDAFHWKYVYDQYGNQRSGFAVEGEWKVAREDSLTV